MADNASALGALLPVTPVIRNAYANSVPEFWNNYSRNPGNYTFVYELMSPEEAGKPHSAPYNFVADKKMYPDARWNAIQ